MLSSSVGRLLAALVILLALATSCATTGARNAADADYVLAYLKTGPNSGKQTKEESAKIFGGHMANIKRLADEGDLCIAGPFGPARDKSWRGILLLDTPSVEHAEELVATDPGMQSGVFIAELHAVRASTALRRVMEFERAMLAEQAVAKEEAPPNIRGYVMVTATDGDAAAKTLAARADKIGRVIWCARLLEGGGGVFALDATKPEDVQASLSDSPDLGVDGWWSTTSIMKLPAEAGSWE